MRRHRNGAVPNGAAAGEGGRRHQPLRRDAGGESDVRVGAAGVGVCPVDEDVLEFPCGEEVGFQDSVQLRGNALVPLGSVYGAHDVRGVLPRGSRLPVSCLFGV